MNTAPSPHTMANFAGLLRAALGDNLAADATTFLAMMAEDGVMEFPYLSASPAPRLEGRAALSAHLASLEEIDGFHDLQVHKSQEPGCLSSSSPVPVAAPGRADRTISATSR